MHVSASERETAINALHGLFNRRSDPNWQGSADELLKALKISAGARGGLWITLVLRALRSELEQFGLNVTITDGDAGTTISIVRTRELEPPVLRDRYAPAGRRT